MLRTETSPPMGFDERLAFLDGQLVSADMVLAVHLERGSLCSCGRRRPCVHGESVTARRKAYELERAALVGPTTVLAQVPSPMEHSKAGPEARRPDVRRRWWRRR